MASATATDIRIIQLVSFTVETSWGKAIALVQRQVSFRIAREKRLFDLIEPESLMRLARGGKYMLVFFLVKVFFVNSNRKLDWIEIHVRTTSGALRKTENDPIFWTREQTQTDKNCHAGRTNGLGSVTKPKIVPELIEGSIIDLYHLNKFF